LRYNQDEVIPVSENVKWNRFIDAILRDVSETEKAIMNGTASVYSTPDELFAAWNEEDECESVR